MTASRKEREQFIATMTAEGVPYEIACKVLRHAATIQRLAVVACNDEYADRDRVRCPADPRHGRTAKGAPCLCDGAGYDKREGEAHARIPRYMVQDWHAERRIVTLLAPFNVRPNFQGDPRGACVKLIVPSGKWDSWGGREDGLCVPTPNY